MDTLSISPTPKTPEIVFNAGGQLVIKGRSIPENSIDFFKPVYDWLDSYSTKPSAETVFEVKLEYFNTSSSKCLLDIFRRLENLSKTGAAVKINWFYETDDEDMQEAGEDYKSILNMPFNIMAS